MNIGIVSMIFWVLIGIGLIIFFAITKRKIERMEAEIKFLEIFFK